MPIYGSYDEKFEDMYIYLYFEKFGIPFYRPITRKEYKKWNKVHLEYRIQNNNLEHLVSIKRQKRWMVIPDLCTLKDLLDWVGENVTRGNAIREINSMGYHWKSIVSDIEAINKRRYYQNPGLIKISGIDYDLITLMVAQIRRNSTN